MNIILKVFMNLVEKFEQKKLKEVQESRGNDKFENFNVGDTINVGVKIADVSGFRTQSFEGICIARSNKSVRSSFTVRRIGAGGEGIEQMFMLYLSDIEFIKVIKRGVVRRAKLYYLRNLKGKAAKVKERHSFKKNAK